MKKETGFIIILISFYLMSCKNKNQTLIELKHEMILPSTTISRFSDRGILLINDSLYLNAESKYLYNDSSYVWDFNGPIIKFGKSPYHLKLADLSIPYILTKKPLNDTLFVLKDGYLLLFELPDYIR